MPLRRFREDAAALSPADFEERHGSAFLLVSAAELRDPLGPCSTQVNLGHAEERASDRTAVLSLLVFAVRRSDRSVGHLVTAGRTSNNDIVLADPSVSRFHAFFKSEANGRFRIQDANSSNGTRLNGAAVPAQGKGPAADLKPGDNLRMGQVELTFLSAEALQEFAREAGGQSKSSGERRRARST